MLTRLREIVEKVASAPRLNEALDILVTDVCQAMETEVCSVYLADNDRRCYYLMATRGLKKPRGRTVALAFDEGLVGLVGRLAEPINLADAQKHPSFKYIPAVKEDRFRAFLGVPIIQRRQLLGVLVVQQRELRQFDESEESFLVTLATQMAAILSQSQLNALFGQYRQTRIRALPASSGVAIAEGWMDVSLPLMEQVYEASTLDTASERERQVAEKLAQGMAVKEIAAELGLSPKTVHVHRANLLEKLGVSNDVELARRMFDSWQ